MTTKRLFSAIAISASIFLASCGPKDADIKTAIETKLNSEPGMANVTADVKDGVATITGQCKDDACRANCEKDAREVKGVKSVINNLTVAAAPPPQAAPVTITPDDPLTQSVTDATKDFPGVKADVKDGVITLTGEIDRSQLPKLMKSLSTLKPKKIQNQLTFKTGK
jgi:hyperosmotically inducible protein